MTYDVIILGGGAAGYSAAIYSRRYLLKTALIQGQMPGGETATAGVVENYPGFTSIDGFELMQKFAEHAQANQAEFITGFVTEIKQRGHCFELLLAGGKKLSSKSIIFALGSEHRQLGLWNETALKGHGVNYCVTCDGPLYKGKRVVLVGGGDSSVKGAALLADYAKQVWLVTREKKLRAEPVNLKRLLAKKNVKLVYETTIKQLVGNTKLEAVELSRAVDGQTTLNVDGIFVEIGLIPRNELPKSLGVKTDKRGDVIVDETMHTNVDGIFACGDLTNAGGGFKQIVTAAAQGALAATSAYQDLGEHGTQLVCELHGKVS